jgi:tetratricopeptide (TPR) repeat protein
VKICCEIGNECRPEHSGEGGLEGLYAQPTPRLPDYEFYEPLDLSNESILTMDPPPFFGGLRAGEDRLLIECDGQYKDLNPAFAAYGAQVDKMVQGLQEDPKEIELIPEIGEPYYNRARTRYGLKDFVGAVADYDKALELCPHCYEAHMLRGSSRNYLGDYEGAAADYTMAIGMAPAFAAAYYNRATARSKLGDREGAEADFRKAKELNPALNRK